MMHTVYTRDLLAQSDAFSSTEVMLWLGGIVLLAVVLAVAALWVRRKLFAGRDQPPAVGFTLADLRKLHAEGQLSDEELAAAEQRTLAHSRSHYLGVEPGAEPPVDGGGDRSSTIDPPDGPENAGGDPDKNPGPGRAD